ncbi:MAG: ATP-dependent helicase [Phycisphaerales bacterium]
MSAPAPSAAAAHTDTVNLNAAQKQAVEHDSGPLLVLAGPGTGKTRVIIHRIAHAVRARDIEPERIVALTYTVKAAGEMRERLADACDPGIADRVHVHTLHGFGLHLLQRFGDMLGLPGQPELLDSARRRRLLRELVAEHRLFPQMTASKRDETLAWVEAQADLLADHAISSAQARAFCAAWRGRLDRGEGIEDAADARAQEEHLLDFTHLAQLRDLYDAARLKRGWLAYSDFLTLPARLLREHAGVAAIVRSDYRHYLVDEFQDTNAAQIDLLTLLAPPAENPDLCVVGDDDQAIYAFRGADERAFDKFAARWPAYKKVRLEINHRSLPSIIATANRVIDEAHHRFDRTKLIRRPSPDPAATGPDPAGHVIGVKLVKYQDDGEAIAAMILARRHQHPELAWKDFAVLARNHGDLARVATALQIEGIPVRRVVKEADPEEGVLDLLAWIKSFVEPHDTIAVRRLLVRPPRGVPPDRVSQWEHLYRAQRSRSAGEEPGTADPGGFVPWLAAHAPSVPAVQSFARLYTSLAPQAATGRADEFIFQLICAADLAHAELLAPKDRAARVAALVRVVRFARTRQSRLDEPGDLRAWWAYYNDLSVQEQSFLEENDIDAGERQDDNGEADDAVPLMTIHTAKGLEFDTVFTTRLQPDLFPRVRVDRDKGLPEGLDDRAGDTRTPKDRVLDEERRLFYVACTRAKRRLILLSRWSKRPSPSPHFFQELFRNPGAEPAGDLLDSAAIIAGAARLGVGPGARTAPTGMEGETPPALAGRSTDRRDTLAHARREARVLAASALQQADNPALDEPAFADITRSLQSAAQRMAAIAAVEAGTPAPAWLGPDARAATAALAARLGGVAAGEPSAASSLPCLAVLRPPLRLSFSLIKDYERCPRCFFVKHVLGMPESPSGAIDMGKAAHRALEEFFGRFQQADAEGTPLPTLSDLLEAGRRAFLGLTAHDAEIDRRALARLLDQLTVVFERLHNSADHILEREKAYPFPYACNGREHRFSAFIDRLDQLPSGGVRIIDYKSGQARKGYTEPKADDLQLGVYALAVAHSRGIDPAALTGTAEYWLLSTGQRGTLDLGALRLDKVRKRIDTAVEGILKGLYPQGKQCMGECAMLGPTAPADDTTDDD